MTRSANLYEGEGARVRHGDRSRATVRLAGSRVASSVVRLNSISGLVLTRLDVLSGVAKLKVATEYEGPKGRQRYVPTDVEAFASLTPVYEELEGWSEGTRRGTHAGRLAVGSPEVLGVR